MKPKDQEKRTKNNQDIPILKTSDIAVNILAALAFILPFGAWFIASTINPTGWASGSVWGIFYPIAIFPFWQALLALAILLLIILYIFKKQFYFVYVLYVILLAIASVFYSVFVFNFVVSASDTEFTG